MEILKVEDVRKSFRGDISLRRREVLRGVSLHADPGEILGFLGPNGAGKTTAIKIILGLMRPDSGSVSIFGGRPGDKAVMRRIGYLPENPYFYPHLTLREFLAFCARMSGVEENRMNRNVDEAVEAAGLAPHAGRRLKGFSKGMTQRAGLAQAIIHDPDLLVLDEPFSGLDPVGRKTVRETILELRRRGRTIFFSSHILPDMEALCDRMCIIREGVVARSVGLDEVFRMGEGRVEVTARGCSAEDLRPLAEYLDKAEFNGDEVFLLVRGQELVRTVIQHVYNSGGEILSVSNRHPSLEDVFMAEIAGRPGAAGERPNVLTAGGSPVKGGGS